MVLSIEAIPLGVVISFVFPGCQPDAGLGRPLRRRSRFWLRFAGVVIAMLLPDLVAILAPLGEGPAGALLWSGFVWGLLLLVPSRFVLFHGSGPRPGPGEEDGEGPGPGDAGPTPPAPRVPVGRLASGSASRHGYGRYGCGRRGVTTEGAFGSDERTRFGSGPTRPCCATSRRTASL